MAVPEKYSHIDFKPPNGVRREAEYGLKLREEHGRGGTAIGVARARDLSNGRKLSPQTVKRMKAFFDRHASDSKAEGYNRGEKGWPSAGKVANLLWGGPSGETWANKIVSQMEAADRKEESRALRPFGSSFGMTPRVTVVHGPPAAGKTGYVLENKKPGDVVFDFNSIMSAISGNSIYHSDDSLISYCTDIRTLMIEKALRKGSDNHCWIIVTSPDDSLRSSLKDVPTNYVEVECDKEECLRRIESDPGRPESHKQVVEQYFEKRSSTVKDIERRYYGRFNDPSKPDHNELGVERRVDPETGKNQVFLVGYAAKFGTDSLMMGDFIERIDPGAFEIVEKGKDFDGKPLETRGLYNHDPNHLIGRFPDTMKLTVDSKGLRYQILLPESRHDLAELVSRGDLRGSSFSFVVAEDGERWSTEDGQSIRTVTKVKSLLDCGPVTYPAYADSTVAVAKRSFQEYQRNKKAPRSSATHRSAQKDIEKFISKRTPQKNSESRNLTKSKSVSGKRKSKSKPDGFVSDSLRSTIKFLKERT
jgi:HK97 family phage prohead protease